MISKGRAAKPIRRRGRVITVNLFALREAVAAGTLSAGERELYRECFGEDPERIHPKHSAGSRSR